MIPGRRDGRVGGRLHVCFDIGLLREAAVHSVLVGVLYPVGRWSNVERAGMLQAGRCAGETLEAGQFFQRDIELDDRALRLEMRDAFEKAFIQFGIRAELQEGAFGIGVRENRPGSHLFAILQPHAFGLAVMHQYLGDRRIGANHRAVRLGGYRHSEADASHAAAHVSPHAVFTVDLAKHMVPGDVDRTRGLWPDKGTYHTLSCPGCA